MESDHPKTTIYPPPEVFYTAMENFQENCDVNGSQRIISMQFAYLISSSA
jgi:hypothetical protein